MTPNFDATAVDPPAPSPTPTIPLAVYKVVKTVAERHGLLVSDIFSEFADRESIDCRAEIFWRLKHAQTKPLGVSALARMFRKSRTTVARCLEHHTRLRILAQRGSFS